MIASHDLSLKFSKNLCAFATWRENKRMKYNSRSIHLNKIFKRYEAPIHKTKRNKKKAMLESSVNKTKLEFKATIILLFL